MTTPRSPRTEAGLLYAARQLVKVYDQPDTSARQRNLVYWMQALREEVEAEAAAPRSGEGLDAADRHEGPTPRDCPECLRLHDDEAAPREASEGLRNAGEVMRNGPSKATSLPDELPFSVAPREASEPPST